MPISEERHRELYDQAFPPSYPIETPPPVYRTRRPKLNAKTPGYGIGWVLTKDQVNRIYKPDSGLIDFHKMKKHVLTNWRMLKKDPTINKELLREGPDFMPALDHFIVYFYINTKKDVMDSLIPIKDELFELYFKALGVDGVHKIELRDNFKWYRTIVWEDI